MNEPSDDALMQSIKARDQAAFNCLLGRHLPAVHQYLSRMTGSAADSDELCQETFLRVWNAARSYRPGRVRFTTWLHRIAHNLCVDEARRQRPEPLQDALPAEDPGPGPEGRAQLAQEQRALQQALLTLPEAQRSALLLCHVQGFSNREAAAIMKISARAVESLLARARRGLRRQLQAAETSDRHPTGANGAAAGDPSGARPATRNRHHDHE